MGKFNIMVKRIEALILAMMMTVSLFANTNVYASEVTNEEVENYFEDADMQLEEEEEIVEDSDDVAEEAMMYAEFDMSEYLIQSGSFSVCEESLYGNDEGAKTAIYEGCKAKQESINIYSYNISKDAIFDLFVSAVNEHPDLYYIFTECSYSYSGTRVANVYPTYISDELDEEAFDRAVNKALATVNDDMTDLEKAVALHDYIAINTKYNEYVGNGGIVEGPDPIFSAYGVFVNQDAVCQGYSLAYKLLLDKVGIECATVTSANIGHAWNYVKLDGEYYNVDVTWDDPRFKYTTTSDITYYGDTYGYVAHNYMFLSDAEFKKTHKSDDWVIYYKGDTSTVKQAKDTTYDGYYWSEVKSPFVFDENNNAYYISPLVSSEFARYIYKVNILNEGTESDRVWSIPYLQDIGYDSYGYMTYGLYSYNNRLYFNTYNQIEGLNCSNKSELHTKYNLKGQVIGSALCYDVQNDCDVIRVRRGKSEETLDISTVFGLDKYDVIFEDKDGNKITSQSVISGQAATAPSAPEVTGYEFDGWNKKIDCIKESMTVTAQYKPIEYDINYVIGEGAANSATNPSKYNIENSVTLEKPTRQYYTFEGWYDNDKFTGTPVTGITKGTIGEKTFYAKWTADKPESPAITVDNSKELENGHILIDAGTLVELSGANGGKIYYTIDGTSPTSASIAYKNSFAVNKNTTVKAVVVRNGITSEANSVVFEIAQNTLVLKDATIELKENEEKNIEVSILPSTKKMSDISWDSLNDEVVSVGADGKLTGIFEGSTEIEATTTDWRGRTVKSTVSVSVIPNTFSVKFYGLNKAFICEKKVLGRRDAVAPSAPTVIGYKFEKWDKTFSNVTEDLEVNAVYTPIDYDIQYNLIKTGAINDEDNPAKYNAATAVTLKNPKLEGYTFAGWYKNSSYAGAAVTEIDLNTTGNIALYAKWIPSKPGNPVITVDEGCNLSSGEVLVNPGTEVSISSETGTKIYYTINGKTPSSSSTAYSEKIILNENTIVKAISFRENEKSDIVTKEFVIAQNDILLNNHETSIDTGDTFGALEGAVLPSTRTAEDIVWSSSNTDVATVDSEGNIVGVFEGTATITAKVTDWNGQEHSDSIVVTVLPKLHEVLFYGFGGKLIEKQPVLNGRDAVAPTMDYIPEGYAFVKWDRAFNNVVENIEVKAVWALVDYELSFSTNKGTVPETIAFNIESSEIVLPTLAKEGYNFAGWYDNESFDGTPITYIPSGSTGDRTLYAKWTNSKTFSLKWEGLDFDEDLRVSYTGKALKPSFEVYYGDKKLEYKKDYTYTFKNNTNAYELEESDEGFVASKAPTLVITGKGNYCATESVPFVIERKSIEDNDIDIIPVSLAFNGKTQKVAPTVSWNGKKLTGKELTFEYISTDERAYIDKGTYDVKITGKGNYCGEKTVNLVISDLKAVVLMKQCKVSITPFDYSGEVIDFTGDKYKSHINVTYNKKPVDYVGDSDEDGYDVQFISSYYNKEGEEYQLQPIKDIGTYTVRIIGKGKYQGEVRATFKINGTSISTAKIAAIPNMIFDGNKKEPALDIKDKAGNPLVKGTDYTVSFTSNTDVGTASVTITGINKYYGTTKKTFKITQQIVADLASADNFDISFVGGTDEFVYAKNGVTPKLDVIYKYTNKQGDPATTKLVEGTDYSLSYKNNNTVIPAAGKTPYVILTLKKNFKGTSNIPFTIVQQDLSNLSIAVNDIQEKTVAGKYMSTPTITDVNGKKLGKGDYITTYEYRDKDNNQLLDKYSKPVAGDTIAITVTGTKNYKGTITGYYRVFAAGKSISSATIKIKPEVLNEVRYTGEAIMLSKDDLEIKIGKNVYLTTDDFDIKESSYINNINKGTAKVTIVGKGDYAGTKTISFTIKQKAFIWWWK